MSPSQTLQHDAQPAAPGWAHRPALAAAPAQVNTGAAADAGKNPLALALALALALVLSATCGQAGAAAFGRVTGHPSVASLAQAAQAAQSAPTAATTFMAAPDLTLNLAGSISYDAVDAAINTVRSLTALPSAAVDQVSWSLTLSTFGASWLDEATVLIVNSAGDGVFFNAGFGNGFSGTAAYSGSASLAGLGIPFNVLGDGRLFVQFYESFDDNPGAADAVYSSGSLTLAGIAAVPEPDSFGLLALGLFAVGGLVRRCSRRRDRDVEANSA